MLNRMSMKPRPDRPVAGARNADVISRYHSPAATPCRGPAAGYAAYPSISKSLTMPGRTQVTRNTATLMATSVQVTAALATGRPPKVVRAWRVLRAPSPTHSTHCWPTEAERMQSGHAWRPHRTQETYVSRPGWRKQVGTPWSPPGPGATPSGRLCPPGPGSLGVLTAWSNQLGSAITVLDRDRVDGHVFHRPVLAARLDPADQVNHVGALDDLAEDGVLAVQPGRRHDRDEELRAVGAGSGVRHGQQVRPVERKVWMDFVGELVAGSAAAGSERVAALDHEVGDDPGEHGPVVQPGGGGLPGARVRPLPAALGKLHEIAYRLRRVIREEADDNRPLVGAQRRGQRLCHAVDPSSGQLKSGHFVVVNFLQSSPYR